ncbi:MAG: AbrB/MazE/SpoVT family DNA-binding domain-containing protein [Anaerotruncus sp.]|nr:AbrB/MazE/SpoVT family DNA-binding domain-containing protein [Anaerotruncus sp.]
MHTKIYRVIDEKGRIYLPMTCRETAGIEPGDIVRLEVGPKKISAYKVDLIELGDKSPEALVAYILAGMPQLNGPQLQEVATELFRCLQSKISGRDAHEDEV